MIVGWRLINWGKILVEVFEFKRLFFCGFFVVYVGFVILWVKKLEYMLCYWVVREI